MDKKISDFFSQLEFVREVTEKIKSGEKIIPITALPETVKSLFVKYVFESGKSVLLLLPEKQKVNEFCVELSILGLYGNVISIPELDLETLQETLPDATSLLNVVVN